MPAPHTVPRLLRRQLISSPSPSSPQSYILPIRKLLVSYHEKLESHRGLRAWIQRHAPAIARKFPSVEVVLATHLRRGALLKGFYLGNNRTKVIDVQGLDSQQIAHKVQLLLDSSGDKLSHLARHPVVPGGRPPVRGQWSGLHDTGNST